MGDATDAVVVILAGFFFSFPVVLTVALLLFWLIIKPAFSGRKPILAFDYSGVITKGDFFTEKINVNPEMKNLVSRLNKKYKTVVVTNDNALPFNYVSKKFSTDSLFHEKFVSSDIGFQKPDKRFYQKVLEQLNARPEEVIYIDDKPEYTKETSKLGIKSIHFKSRDQLVKDLARYGISA